MYNYVKHRAYKLVTHCEKVVGEKRNNFNTSERQKGKLTSQTCIIRKTKKSQQFVSQNA